MAAHTKEPWNLDPETGQDVIWGGFTIIAHCMGDKWPQDARRICACVNALAGIPTEELEAGVIAEMVELAAFLDKWIDDWVTQMHRDIPDEERGRIADNMCCDWRNSGTGASSRSILSRLGRAEG